MRLRAVDPDHHGHGLSEGVQKLIPGILFPRKSGESGHDRMHHALMISHALPFLDHTCLSHDFLLPVVLLHGQIDLRSRDSGGPFSGPEISCPRGTIPRFGEPVVVFQATVEGAKSCDSGHVVQTLGLCRTAFLDRRVANTWRSRRCRVSLRHLLAILLGAQFLSFRFGLQEPVCRRWAKILDQRCV